MHMENLTRYLSAIAQGHVINMKSSYASMLMLDVSLILQLLYLFEGIT